MSLGGLAVAIGLIIDDSVVVVENIARHLAEGQTGDAAIDRASREISGAVIGSTLTTILVFVPLAFVRGVVGPVLPVAEPRADAWPLLVSMVVSLTIIPVLAARFLGRAAMPTTGPIYNVLADGYEGLLRVGLAMSPRLAVVPGAAGGRARAGGSSTTLETGFMPEMDEGAFVLDYFMPVGTSLAETDKVLRRVEKTCSPNTPDVAGYLRRTGAENWASSPPSRTRGDILVSLKPPGQRRPMDEIFDALREQLQGRSARAGDRDSCRWSGTRSTIWAASTARSRSRSSGPTSAKLRELADRGRQDRGRRNREQCRRERPRLPRQPRYRRPARQRQTGPRRADASRTSRPSSTRPSTARWPARCPSRTA